MFSFFDLLIGKGLSGERRGFTLPKSVLLLLLVQFMVVSSDCILYAFLIM